MNELKLELYWNDIPVGRDNAVEYSDLMNWWGRDKREVRKILHRLSVWDNGDDYVLVRSGKARGFYRTDDPEEIKAYRAECLKKGRAVMAPAKKCNRVLGSSEQQYRIDNNLRVCREAAGLRMKDVCEAMRADDPHFDAPMLSKMENGVCLPTTLQTARLAEIYGCRPSDLVRIEFL